MQIQKVIDGEELINDNYRDLYLLLQKSPCITLRHITS